MWSQHINTWVKEKNKTDTKLKQKKPFLNIKIYFHAANDLNHLKIVHKRISRNETVYLHKKKFTVTFQNIILQLEG